MRLAKELWDNNLQSGSSDPEAAEQMVNRLKDLLKSKDRDKGGLRKYADDIYDFSRVKVQDYFGSRTIQDAPGFEQIRLPISTVVPEKIGASGSNESKPKKKRIRLED